jgi:hypothetical protein
VSFVSNPTDTAARNLRGTFAEDTVEIHLERPHAGLIDPCMLVEIETVAWAG